MLTYKASGETRDISVSIQGKPLNGLLEKEWLLTNSRGGFAAAKLSSPARAPRSLCRPLQRERPANFGRLPDC